MFRSMSVTASTAVSVRVLLFAAYAEAAGHDEVVLSVGHPATVADVINAFRQAHPTADRLPPRPLVAVNQVHAGLDSPVRAGDEIALLPPMAGG
jgi:molybdopterin converting factor small subunit